MKDRFTELELERFWAKVNKTNECWLWTGGRKGNPTHRYGGYVIRGKYYVVHRLSFELASDTLIPPGMIICHRCDNPVCVKPEHLFLGTQFDNQRDCENKGRRKKSDVFRPGVLTEAQVIEIRAALARGANRNRLAFLYGVTWPTIDKIRTRKTWKKVG